MIADAVHAIPGHLLLPAGIAFALAAAVLAVWLGRLMHHLGRHMSGEARRGFIVVGLFLAAMIAWAFWGKH